jgi:hypothetical protein
MRQPDAAVFDAKILRLSTTQPVAGAVLQEILRAGPQRNSIGEG